MSDINTGYLSRPVRVLAIEDNPGDVNLLQTYLDGSTRIDGDLIPVSTLEEAFLQLASDKFDLVFLDLNLPDSHGLETLHRFQERRFDVPIVVITGISDERLGVAAVKAGAQDFLVKGAHVEQNLERTIRYALERHRLQRSLREMALRDDLTQLYNRRGFRLVGEQSLELARRKGYPITVLYIDVDHLKSVNDNYGHSTGDRVLELTADVIRQSYRASDVVARMGGDEFVLLAIDCAQHDAEILRLRLIAGAESAADQANLPCALTLTVGIACYPPGNDLSVMDMVTQADQAMYRVRGNSVGETGRADLGDRTPDRREPGAADAKRAKDRS